MLSDPCFYGQLVRQGLPSLNLEFATVAALNSVLCFEFLGLTLKHQILMANIDGKYSWQTITRTAMYRYAYATKCSAY